jgi:chromosomal replication initiation ATPase DnaA
LQKILKEEWEKILDLLKEESTEISFNTWISPITPLYIEENKFYIEVPTDFHRNNISSRFDTLIKNTIKFVKNADYELIYLIPDEAKKQEEKILPGVKNSDQTAGASSSSAPARSALSSSSSNSNSSSNSTVVAAISFFICAIKQPQAAPPMAEMARKVLARLFFFAQRTRKRKKIKYSLR